MPHPLYQVDFEPIGKRIDVAPGVTLLEAAQQAGLTLASACGGVGNCGQCRVTLMEGQLSPPTLDEEFILTELELQNGERLACSAEVCGPVKIHIPNSSLITTQRLQLGGETINMALDPLIIAFQIETSPPSLHDLRADVQRLAAGLGAIDIQAGPAVIRQLSGVARQENWQLTAFLRHNELVGVAPAETSPLGLAVDLGTTKVAASLIDLTTGAELAVTGTLNPQIGYGEDVISRLTYARRHADGAHTLAAKIQSTLDELVGQLVAQAGVNRAQVADVCIVGNTAMTHLLLELPVQHLAVAPYVAASNGPMDVKATELGLNIAPGAYVHILPGIGGFVGADHMAMVLASGLDRPNHVALGIDIGTNTEIALVKPDENMLMAASCASGPAFEGAHISDGMRAAAGAIEAVNLTESGFILKTVDDAPAVGLCGSGIIDTVAELRRRNLVNTRGRFDRTHRWVRQGRHGPELVLVSADHSGNGREVVITQNDLNEIQLAKGAIRAGLEILLEATHTPPEVVTEVVIAGAFGSYIKVSSALDMGLLPRLPNAHYRQVGNAAIVGARWALLSRQIRTRARDLANQIRYLELTTYPKFNRHFALGMLFPELDE